MKHAFLAYSLSVLSAALPAQQIPTEWEAKSRIASLTKTVEEIEAVLVKLDLERWKSAGAAEAYLTQYHEAKPQFGALRRNLAELASNPDRVGAALDVLLRFEAVDHYIHSLREASRKFDEAALADELDAKVGESFTVRDRFRNYVVELARDRDTQYAILLKEAQRCRTDVNTPPAAKRPAKPAVPPATSPSQKP